MLKKLKCRHMDALLLICLIIIPCCCCNIAEALLFKITSEEKLLRIYGTKVM